jgi:hypothetical protein
MRVLLSCRIAGIVLAVIAAAPGHAAPRCAGDVFSILTAEGGHAPFIRLSARGRSGAFLLDYGSTASSLSQDVFGDLAGVGGMASDFSLPTFDRGRFALVRYGVLRSPPGGQAGMVGTDFLSLLTADFSFGADGRADVVLGSEPCARDVLLRRGLAGVRQDGYFSSDIKRVRRDRANVPVVPLRLGPLTVPAQLDTGYEDRVFAPSADINEALYRRLVAAGVELRRAATVRVTTCAGEEQREVFVADTTTAELVADDGQTLLQLPGLALVRKPPGQCGGIGDMEEPAAQLGASVLWRIGEIVFDPKAEMLWMGNTNAPTARRPR